jgi:adenylate kinase
MSSTPSISVTVEKPLYFMGGAHGVGKSTLASMLADRSGADHVSAGTLIRHASASARPEGDKTVGDVDGNQEILLSALSLWPRREQGLILDGHFCLLGLGDTISPIPLAVFERMTPRGFILVEAAPETVVQRLNARDGKRYDPCLVAELIRRERDHAELMSDRLKVPMHRYESGTPVDEVVAFLSSLGR